MASQFGHFNEADGSYAGSRLLWVICKVAQLLCCLSAAEQANAGVIYGTSAAASFLSFPGFRHDALALDADPAVAFPAGPIGTERAKFLVASSNP